MKYIVNTTEYTHSVQPIGKPITTFPTRKLNPYTGLVETTGVTPIDEDKLEELGKLPMFKTLLSSGKLVVRDDIPKEALLDAQALDLERKEVIRLKGEVARLEDLIAQGADKGLLSDLADERQKNKVLEQTNADLENKNKELTEALEKAQAELDEGHL